MNGGESTIPVVVIDVRTERELNADGKIPGSHNIPIAKIKEALMMPENEFFQKYGFKNQVKATKMSFWHVKLEVGQTLQENCFKNKVTITSEFMKEVSSIGAKIMVLFAFQMTKIVRL